ncbi:hypothetical protein ACTXT7_007127 [Hymenolepis weldensis]
MIKNSVARYRFLFDMMRVFSKGLFKYPSLLHEALSPRKIFMGSKTPIDGEDIREDTTLYVPELRPRLFGSLP